MRMTGGEALVRQLMKEGIGDLFMVPGVQLDWATDALRKADGGIRCFIPRHEQTTAYMADGYARTTGKIGACMVVPGPGLLNTMAALSTAYACNSRVLAISGHIHSSGIGKGAGLLHEINNQDMILGSVTKWHGRPSKMEEIPAMVREAVRQLNTGRPLPTGLEIPHDLLATTGEVDLIDPPADEREAGRIPPNAAGIAAAAELLSGAEFPVLYVGGGVLAAGASAALADLAERLDAPVVMSENGRGALSDRHPLALNAVGGRAVFRQADVVLVVGSRFIDTGTGAPVLPMDHARYVFLNIDPTTFATPRTPAMTIEADAKLGLEALAAAVRPRPARLAPMLDRVRQWVARQTAALTPQMDWLRALREAIPDDGILVNELTQVGYVARSHYPVYAPDTYISPGYQGTLGYGFPTALGVAVGNPDKVVVGITGDGGFGWNLQELATAKRYGLDMVQVVFNDGHFGNVRTLQRAAFGESFGDVLTNPDFGKLAEAFGVRYTRIDGPGDLAEAIAAARKAGGPTLIEAPVTAMPSPWHLMRLTPPPAGAGIPPNPFEEDELAR